MQFSALNRWHRVRVWAPGVGGLCARDNVSPPYLLERPSKANGYRGRLTPVGPEWWRDRKGRHHKVADIAQARAVMQIAHEGAIIFPALLPTPIRAALVMALGIAPLWLGDPGVTLAAMMGSMSMKAAPQTFGVFGNGTTDVTQLLDALMVFGVTGDAFAIGFKAPAKTVESLYAYVTAETGTSAMALRLRTRTSNLPVNPATQEATGLAAAATGWNEFAGLSTLLTYGTQYYLSIEDGTATDNITVQIGNNRLLGNIFGTPIANDGIFWRTITTNGWTGQTAALSSASGVVTFSDGTALGNPISASSTPSETQKGTYWIGGPTEDLDIYGVVVSDTHTSATFSAGQIWSGTNGPTGTADTDSSTITIPDATTQTALFGWLTSAASVRLTGGTNYRIVLKLTSAQTTGPRKYSIGTVVTGGIADLKLCLPWGGNWQWTDETASAWVDDSEGFAGVGLLLEDQVAISGGGGGMVRIIA